MQKNRKNPQPQHGGFTLVEVMIVLFILVMIMGLAIGIVRGQQAKAQRQAAFTYVKMLENAVDQYTTSIGRPPSNEQGLQALVQCPQDVPEGSWAGPYIKSTARSTDPWGNEYQYACPGRNGAEFEIWSYGPDMINGTADDIGTWMNEI